jgi:ribosome-associated protein
LVKDILIRDEIKLDQFLKWSRVASTGGQSKLLIAGDMVKVNGRLEKKRSRKLKHGDLVEVENMGSFRVVTEQECS